MRIISGNLRGRQIHAPSHFKLRPTTDIAKESLFNILNNIYYFDEISVIDLFAGIGSISFEFISRGAAQVYSVEKNYKHAEFIRKTAEQLQVVNRMAVLTSDVRDVLKSHGNQYDIVFADPPYDLPWIDQLADLILGSNIVKNGALVIIEHPKEVNYTNNACYTRTRKYGKVNFSMFEK